MAKFAEFDFHEVRE